MISPFFLPAAQNPLLKQALDSTKYYWFLDIERSMIFANSALSICNPTDCEYYGECLKNKGVVFYFIKQNDSADFYYQKALETYRACQDTSGIQKTLNNLGVLKMESGIFDQALTYYEEAYSLALSLSDTLAIIRALNNVSNVYIDLKKPDKSIEYLNSAKKYLTHITDQRIKAQTYGNLFSTYRYLGDLKNFNFYSKKALEGYSQLQDSIGLANTYTNIANGLELFNKIDSAIYLNLCALRIYKIKKHITGIVHLHLSIGNNYRNKQKYSVSTNYYLEGLKMAENHQLEKYIRDFNHELYINMLIQGEPVLAREYQQKAEELDQKFTSSLVNNAIASMEVKYKTLEQKREIESLSAKTALQELKLESEHRKKTIIIILFSIIILSGIFFIFWYRLFQQRKHAILMAKKAELENSLLRAQMNPHFMFNCLNSLQTYITCNQTALAEDFLSRFALLTRMILNQSREEFILLSDESNTLQTYLALEKQRHNNSFSFKLIIDEDIDESFICIPPMLVQPFAENAILHGLSPLKKDGILEIHFLPHSPKTLKCTILDNGIGRVASSKINKTYKHKSMGMQLTQERLKLIEIQTGLNITITTTDLYNQLNEACGTKVELIIPFKNI